MNQTSLKRAPAALSTRVTLVVAAAFFMLQLDGAIINTSLPQIARDLRVGPVEMNLGVTAYLLAVAAVTPLSAWLADRLGAKRVFIAAMAIFTAASAGCAAATSLPMLVVARVAQGIGGALMLPVGRTIVLRVAGPAELMRATALLTWPTLIAPVIGPVIGGAITSLAGWRWNFLLNLPLGLVGGVLAWAVVRDDGERDPKPLDRPGAVLTGGAVFLLVYGLSRLAGGRDIGVSLACLGFGGVAAVLAWRWLRRTEHPLLDLRPLQAPTFAIAAANAGSLLLIAVSAAPFLLPLMMQTAWGVGPLRAGEWLLVYFLGNLVMKTCTTAILRRWGFRRVMVAAGLAIGASVAACGQLRPVTPVAATALVLFAAGAARSMQMTALNTLAFSDIAPKRRSSASTLFSMLQQSAMAAGVALAAVAVSVSQHLHGAPRPAQGDFAAALALCGLLAAVGALLCLRLGPAAGAHVSGHAPRGPATGGLAGEAAEGVEGSA